MTRIVLETDVAERIRQSSGAVELVDEQGKRLGVFRRPPTDAEIALARGRVGAAGPKFTVEQLIAKVEAS